MWSKERLGAEIFSLQWASIMRPKIILLMIILGAIMSFCEAEETPEAETQQEIQSLIRISNKTTSSCKKEVTYSRTAFSTFFLRTSNVLFKTRYHLVFVLDCRLVRDSNPSFSHRERRRFGLSAN